MSWGKACSVFEMYVSQLHYTLEANFNDLDLLKILMWKDAVTIHPEHAMLTIHRLCRIW